MPMPMHSETSKAIGPSASQHQQQEQVEMWKHEGSWVLLGAFLVDLILFSAIFRNNKSMENDQQPGIDSQIRNVVSLL